MNAQQWIHVTTVLLAVTVAACAGGSGSSGFDISPDLENALISQSLQQQECVQEAGALTICPVAGGTATVPPDGPFPPEGIAFDIPFGGTDRLTCIAVADEGPCAATVSFTSLGFPDDAAFRVALRSVQPPGEWVIGGPPAVEQGPAGPRLSASVEFPTDSARTQLAVLVFLELHPPSGGMIATLTASGADVAFVTPALSVDIAVP